MNLKFNKSQFKEKFGYSVGPAAALDDSTLQTRAQNYKRTLSNSMYPIDRSGILEKIPNLEGFQVSRKMDGEFCLVFFDGKSCVSCNPGGTVRAGLPCFEEAARLLKDAKISSAVLACELYVQKEGRERVHDVVRVARNPSSRKEVASLAIYVFDLLVIDGESFEAVAELPERISEIFSSGALAKTIECRRADNKHQIENIYEEWVEKEGSEGVVIRHPTVGMFKVKPVHPIDCVVVGFSDSANERKGMLHDLLLGLFRPDGNIQLLGKAGGGFSEDQRKELYAALKKKTVESNYVEVSSAYLAYEWVKPEMVVEINCLDVISTGSRGDNINRMVLRWDDDRNKYLGVRKMPFASVISPRFVRFRDDKSATVEEVSSKQVAAMVEIEDITKSLEDLELPESELLKREVYQKLQGDKLMVRKLLMWKTNKEDSGEYPGFVVFYTDFSSGRKEALATKIYPAKSLEGAEAQYAKVRDEAVKKGWDKYGPDIQ